MQNGDVRTLLTCLDDVTCGDASQEDIDPQLYKALQMAQYGSQYLLSCRKVMKDREAVLKAALKAFQQEEDVLDLKLAKLRYVEHAWTHNMRNEPLMPSKILTFHTYFCEQSARQGPASRGQGP